MTDERRDAMHEWWAGLPDDRKMAYREIVRSNTPLTWEQVTELTKANVLVAGAKWEHEADFTFHVPDDLADFVEAQTSESD